MKRWIAAGTAVVLGFGLAGCTPEPAPPVEVTPWPPQTSAAPATQTRLSEEEALRIGVETYQAYLQASLDVFDRGYDDGTLANLTDSSIQGEYESTLEIANQEDWSITGEPVFENAKLVSLEESGGVSTIQLTVCADMTDVIRLHEDGTPSRAEGAMLRTPLLVTVISRDGSFRAAGAEGTSMESIC